jgi:hypothetical protein
MVRTPDLVGIFVMETRRGWGAEYPKDLWTSCFSQPALTKRRN